MVLSGYYDFSGSLIGPRIYLNVKVVEFSSVKIIADRIRSICSTVFGEE